MKRKFLIVPALMAGALLAQDPGPRRGAAGTGTHTPPTAAQMAANELTMIARYLKLDSADTTKLTGSTALVADIESEQATLQANAATLKTAYTALATDIATSNTKDVATQVSTIETTTASSLAARVKAAGLVVAALPGLAFATAPTPAQLTGVAQMLVGGGFGGFGGPRGGFGPPPGH
jgi:hypothetical protein